MKHTAWRIDWTEYERGWGQRPDGYQLCVSKQVADNVIKEHIANERKRNPSGEVPYEYSAPGEPREVTINKETFTKVRIKQVIWGD